MTGRRLHRGRESPPSLLLWVIVIWFCIDGTKSFSSQQQRQLPSKLLSTATSKNTSNHVDEKKEKEKKNVILRIASSVYRPIQNKLCPNTLSDLSYSEHPLPPGPLGCPFKGWDIKKSSPSFGASVLFYTMFEKLQRPRIFKLFSGSQNKGIVIVSGYANTKAVLSQEFDAVASQGIPFTAKIVGNRSLRCSQDKEEHGTLRKLAGMAVQPSSVSKLISSIQGTAESLIDQVILESQSHGHEEESDDDKKRTSYNIQMQDVCLKYTLTIACRHIIGLQDFPSEDFDNFLQQVKLWLGALYSRPDETEWKSAREYLVDKIEAKLKYLEVHGPDSSTVSGMFFATENDDSHDSQQRRLTRDEIIDNALLLILAGTETSSATLTNTLLLLGLNKLYKMDNAEKKVENENNIKQLLTTAWSRVVQEQDNLFQKYGTSHLNRTILDDTKYLDGVVRESLRLKPILGGSMRGTKRTIVVDGYQIPAGWGVAYDRYNTHVLDPTTFRDDLSHMNVIQGFDPTRWYKDDSHQAGTAAATTPTTNRPGQEWIPFGVGPRYCLGSDLAMVEMKVFLAVMAQKISDFDLVYPSVQDRSWATDIVWSEKSVIPVPENGVIIRPQNNHPQKVGEVAEGSRVDS